MNSCPRHAVVARRESLVGQGARGITKSMRWCGLAGLVCAFGRAPAPAAGFLHAPKADNGGAALYLIPPCGARAEALCPFGSRDSPWRRSGVPASQVSLTAVEKGHVTRARRLASAQRQCVPQPTAPRTALSAGTDGAGRAERDSSASASALPVYLAGIRMSSPAHVLALAHGCWAPLRGVVPGAGGMRARPHAIWHRTPCAPCSIVLEDH